MKLAVFTSPDAGAFTKERDQSIVETSFQDCRVLSQHQPAVVAARLQRLVAGAEKAIERGASDRFARALRLEEAVFYIASLRPGHAESQALKLCVTRLLRQSFDSLDWRRPFVAGLRRDREQAEEST